jgi:hypothetical protein
LDAWIARKIFIKIYKNWGEDRGVYNFCEGFIDRKLKQLRFGPKDPSSQHKKMRGEEIPKVKIG